MSVPEVGPIGDVGATNARFALVQADGSMTPPRVYALNDYPSISHAIDAYLAEGLPRVLRRPQNLMQINQAAGIA